MLSLLKYILTVLANNFPRGTLSSVQLGDLKLQTCSFQLIDNDKTYGKHQAQETSYYVT